MDLATIVSWLIGKILDWLPGFLIRWAIKPTTIARKVEIRLQSERPFQVSGPNDPVHNIGICFDIVNHSDFDLTLDRLLIELWFGQPTLYSAFLTRRQVSKHKTTAGICHKSFLTDQQKRMIEQFIKTPNSGGQIHLYVTAYFESKIGIVERIERIDRNSI